ncbi:uncharacterized protein LOC144352359 [Saccoglossus kowalevskii]
MVGAEDIIKSETIVKHHGDYWMRVSRLGMGTNNVLGVKADQVDSAPLKVGETYVNDTDCVLCDMTTYTNSWATHVCEKKVCPAVLSGHNEYTPAGDPVLRSSPYVYCHGRTDDLKIIYTCKHLIIDYSVA